MPEQSLPVLDPLHPPRGARSHIFIAASLAHGGNALPVRVRNLSATGALIEGLNLPEASSLVRLQRGAADLAGRMMWVSEGRAGLAFDQPIDVADWVAARAQRPLRLMTRRAALDDLEQLQSELGRASAWLDRTGLESAELAVVRGASARLTAIRAVLERG